MDVQNKIMSAKQCLNATNIIVCAILVAHFIDKAFFSYNDESSPLTNTVWYFVIVFKMSLLILIFFSFFMIRTWVLRDKAILNLNGPIWWTHIVFFTLFLLFYIINETYYLMWLNDPNVDDNVEDNVLRMLAITSACWNFSSVGISSILFYMIDKMTLKVEDAFYDPGLKRTVPFFVYLANCKLALKSVQQPISMQESQGV